MSALLDTHRSVETPEGVELELKPAGPPVRVLAWMVDVVIRWLCYSAFAIGAAFLGKYGMGLFFLLLFLGEWFYPVVFEVLSRGGTPGKKLFKIRVVNLDGTPVGWGASLLRNLVRFADFLPLAYGFGLASMLASPSFQRLGDLAAGTLVVYESTVALPGRMGEGDAPSAFGAEGPPPLPPPVPLSPEEQRSVVEFALRLPSWGPARAAEIARWTAPLTGARGSEGVARLLSIAAWLVGRR